MAMLGQPPGPGAVSIFRNTLYLSSAQAVSSCARAIYAILLARWLSAELYGLLNYGLSWYLLFLPVSALGLNAIIVREIGRDKKQAPRLLGHAHVLRSIATVLLALFCFITGWLTEGDPLSRVLLLIFSLALIGRAVSLWNDTIFTAYEASGLLLGTNIIFRLSEVALGAAALLLGLGVIEVALIHALTWLLEGVAGHILIRRHLLTIPIDWNWRAMSALAKRGIPFMLAASFGAWLIQGPTILFRQIHGLAPELGQLTLSLQAFIIVGSIISQLGTAALPVLSRAVARVDTKADYFLSLVLRGGILFGGVLLISAFAIGPWLVGLLFGDTYQQTATLLPWTLMLVVPFFWKQTLSTMITAHGHFWHVTLCNLVGALAFTITAAITITLWGSAGAVAALGSGLFSAVGLQSAMLRHHHAIVPVNLTARAVLAVGGGLLTGSLLAPLNIWLSLIGGLAGLTLLTFITGAISKKEISACVNFLMSRQHPPVPRESA